MKTLRRICSVDECGRGAIKRGLCLLHYGRSWRAGDLDGQPYYRDRLPTPHEEFTPEWTDNFINATLPAFRRYRQRIEARTREVVERNRALDAWDEQREREVA